jgi:GWxTD domain-containing protein
MSFRALPCLAALAAVALPVAALGAEKLDKDSKKWLDHVRPIMLPDEEKVFRDLKDKGDRDEFRKIFWARRDPSLETPENEYQAEYDKLHAEAEAKFRGVGRAGAESDCGRMYILLGPPDEVKTAQGSDTPGLSPETWTYRDRPTMKFTGGQAQMQFDESCQFPQGARMGEQLLRVAEGKVQRPDLNYRKGADGKLVKLVDQLPKPSPAVTLLKTPRQDFAASAHNHMFLRTAGGSYLAGVVHTPAGTFQGQDAGGTKVAKAVVAVEAVDESGKSSGLREREVEAKVDADGSASASYGLALRPGKYTLKVALLDPATGKGSVVSSPLEVPDFASEEISITPLMALLDIQEGHSPNPKDAYADFILGTTRLVPAPGNVFSAASTLTLLSVIYSPAKDPATGKASVTAGFTISKDGKPVARAQDQTYDSDSPTPSVGPVPLEKYGAGSYQAVLKVRDNVSQKEYTREATFQVK